MLGLALAVYEKQLIVLVVGNHLIKGAENLLILLALFPEGVTLHLLQEADGNVVDLLLVEHGEGVRLPGALVRAASDEEGAVLVDSQ